MADLIKVPDTDLLLDDCAGVFLCGHICLFDKIVGDASPHSKDMMLTDALKYHRVWTRGLYSTCKYLPVGVHIL